MTSTARTGQGLAVLASGMLFAAFASAMIVRRGIAADWTRPELPGWLWLAALLLVVSSVLVRTGRPRAAAACGVLFLAAQAAWMVQLRLAEVAESFLWVFTAAHWAHAAGGIFGLLRFGRGAEIFWHFVGLVWICVLAVFGVWA